MTITSTTYHQIENRIVRLLNEAKKERTNALLAELKELEIGRASCRERV